MTAVQKRSLIAIIVVMLLSSLLVTSGSHAGRTFDEIPIFALCAILAFAIQWLAFVPAFVFQTERYYDLMGSVTYILVMLCAITLSGLTQPHALLLVTLVGIWAMRLGSFLFRRILQDGSDSRFDDIKPIFLRFLLTWTLQGFWVVVTAGSAIAAITSQSRADLGWFAAIGGLIWLCGFVVEVVADRQKRQFRKEHGRKGFIQSGLWFYSRHPNYFGEIVLWIGISIIAIPHLNSWQYATLVSPLFVTLLLTKVSGIPLLEAKSDARWKDDKTYQAYKLSTPVLIPSFGKKTGTG